MKIRQGVSATVLVCVGTWAFFLFLMSMMMFDYGYRPEAHSTLLGFRYGQPLLVFPLFILSLVPRRWAILPLWLVCLSSSLLPYVLNAKQKELLGFLQTPFGYRDVKDIAQIMVIPLLTQFSVWLRQRPETQIAIQP